MAAFLPLFPLGTVVLPGMVVPLHVFEERYRALVSDLLVLPEPADRRFGIVAIREGYEVGSHEARSMFRTGCVVQLTAVEAHPDGRFDIAVKGLGRFRVLATDSSRAYLRAEVEGVGEAPGGDAAELAAAVAECSRVYAAYRHRLGQLGGDTIEARSLPEDPTELSYTLAAGALLPLSDRQQVLEAATTLDRLALVTRHLRAELRAARAVASLPATEIARSGWSPN